jgi:hypothetical protein
VEPHGAPSHKARDGGVVVLRSCCGLYLCYILLYRGFSLRRQSFLARLYLEKGS